MTTIVLAHPSRRCPDFQVFGASDSGDDRHIFGVQQFPSGERDRAERYAQWMMEKHQADHLDRRVDSQEEQQGHASE